MSAGAAVPRRTREITVGVRGVEEVTVTFDPPASLDDADDLARLVGDWLAGLRRRSAERVQDTPPDPRVGVRR